MFHFFKKRREERQARERAFEMGREAGRSLHQSVQEHLDQRLPQVSSRLLDVFRQRLTTIYDEPDHPPEVVAKAEWQIFQKQIDEFPTRLNQEIEESLREWLNVADELHTRDMIGEYIQRRITEASSALREESLLMLAEAAAAVGRRRQQQ